MTCSERLIPCAAARRSTRSSAQTPYSTSRTGYRGRDEIDRIAGVIEVTHPDFQYQPLSPPEVMGDAGPVRWVSGRAREAKQLAARAARTVQSHDAALWSVAPGR
jgi:hypothetical protein